MLIHHYLFAIKFGSTSQPAKEDILVGTLQELIDKILHEHELFGHTRFLAQMSMGDMPHKYIL